MEQHPIPQQVSSYQFKLVGDMTLKQFFQLAGGFLVALIFYSLPIIGIIKWPFAILSAILGALLAFVPLEERPLERWIFAFFKAIYTPTEFFWKRNAITEKFFQDEPATQPIPSPQEALLTTVPPSKLETEEKNFMSKLMGIFNGIITTPSEVASKALHETPLSASDATQSGQKEPVQVPQNVPIKVVPTTVPHMVIEEKPKEDLSVPQITTQNVAPLIAGDEIISTHQAMFSVDAAPPNPPTIPNVIVGQVVDQDRKIIEGAILEIKDVMGRPIRALRSNKAGHFITVTPLENGKYSVITDKDGYEFNAISFEAMGQLIPPILVSGHKVATDSLQTMDYSNQQTVIGNPCRSW